MTPRLFTICIAMASLSVSAADFPKLPNTETDLSIPLVPAQQALAGMKLPEGFTATLFAAEPEVQNPVAMNWDAKGRLWIAENFTYAERTQRFDLSLRDRVVIFDDRDGDGKADSRTVFTEEVQMLTGLCVGHGRVWLPFVLHHPETKSAPASPPSLLKSSPAKTKAKPKGPEISDEEMFNRLFDSDSDRLRNARFLVDDYRAAHRGKSLRELAQDPALTAKLSPLMQEMMTKPELGKQFGEAMQLAMQVKGIKPSPNTNISLSMGDGFLSNESQAERYLGAVLSNDAKALAQLFADVVNEAAVEMALDPGADKTSGGVSISKGPLPPGTKVIQKEPED